MWNFETDPEFQRDLDWADDFVTQEIVPIDLAVGHLEDLSDPKILEALRPLQAEVRKRGLWACHLGPELGGPGYGQLKLALLNEILGRSDSAPRIFGCSAPDTGNAEILAAYGSESQKQRYLKPLMDDEIRSCFSMTEPHAGADPTRFTTRAVRDGNEWVINGEKWFSSNAKNSAFLIVMAVTDPNVSPYEGMSMFIVPIETPGVNILRNVASLGEPEGDGSAAYIRYENVRVSDDHLLGEPGGAFAISQTRLGGGRIHHAMRTVAQVRYAFDLMCERVLSRETKGEVLANKQMVQEQIADSWMEIEQFRLLVLRTAWRIDKYKDYKKVRKDIAAVKVMMVKVLHDVAYRSMHIHGSLGVTYEMPLAKLWLEVPGLAIADGPDEVHKVTIARQVLRDYEPSPGLWPTQHLPARREAARKKLAHLLDLEIGNL